MPPPGLYIQLFSIHGLIRGDDPELGRDADTGGQVKYVLELARCLGAHPAVARVDLFTRLIQDKTVAAIYSQKIEPLSAKARIVRIQCGGRRYIRKELLWPHLDEFVDKTLKFIKIEAGRVPDVFHGHYADGGYVARELASIFGAPFLFTGHSMGRHKKGKLLADGLDPEEINRRYHIDYRIEVEEKVIRDAEQVITSTAHEIDKQYALYDNFAAGSFNIIPPGIDVETFHPYYYAQLDVESESEASRQARLLLLNELNRFWVAPDKPFILAICRPDQRKNISGLITAYAEDKELQAIANLAIFAGIRKDIGLMEEICCCRWTALICMANWPFPRSIIFPPRCRNCTDCARPVTGSLSTRPWLSPSA
jgi:sucrose-phosphate synthase